MGRGILPCRQCLKMRAKYGERCALHGGGHKAKVNRGPCRNCGRVLTLHARRLCYRCNHTPGVKERFPIQDCFARVHIHEPTEAEVEALVEQQMRCLPTWWATERDRFLAVEATRSPDPLSPVERMGAAMSKLLRDLR